MDLRSIAELSYRQIYGDSNDETSLEVEDFIESAKALYATEVMLQAFRERREDGSYNIPSYITKEAEFDVKDNEIDISSLKILRSVPNEMWLINIGGLTCKCKYVKSTITQSELLCDDDSLPSDIRTYYVVGKNIRFPKGAHAAKLPIIYADNGSDLDDSIDVEDALGGIVRIKLMELYNGKIGREDKTNNTNSGT